MADQLPQKAPEPRKDKDFGKRAPKPVVMRKQMDSGPSGSLGQAVSGQKRSLAVSLAVMGALTLGTYEAIDWLDKKLNCEPDPQKPDEMICKHRSSGSTYRRSSSGWHWSSGGSGSSHGFSFGGFGHSGGGFHFGGG